MQNTQIPETYRDIFDKLNSARQTTKRQYTIMSLWPDIPNEKITIDGTHNFWYLNDVLDTVKGLDTEPYQGRHTLDTIICGYAPKEMKSKKNKNSEIYQLLDNHVHFMPPQNNVFNAEISLYAAWAIMKKIGEKYDTTFQQEYFLAPKPEFINIYQSTRELSRITMRKQVAESQKPIRKILGRMHAQSRHYKQMFNHFYESLFSIEEINKLRDRYNISKDNPFPNHMNFYLLVEYKTALDKIVSRFQMLPFSDQTDQYAFDRLWDIVGEEMASIRKSFTERQDKPKNNLCDKTLTQIMTARKEREASFINTHIHEKFG